MADEVISTERNDIIPNSIQITHETKKGEEIYSFNKFYGFEETLGLDDFN